MERKGNSERTRRPRDVLGLLAQVEYHKRRSKWHAEMAEKKAQRFERLLFSDGRGHWRAGDGEE